MADYTWTHKGLEYSMPTEVRNDMLARYGDYSPQDVMTGKANVPRPNSRLVPNVLLRDASRWGVTPSCRMVLLYLYSWADYKTGVASRGVRKIAQETGLAVSTVVDALDHLEGIGWVTCVARDENTLRKKYRIHMAAIVRSLNRVRDGEAVFTDPGCDNPPL